MEQQWFRVVLGPQHPDFDPAVEQTVTAGFVPRERLEQDYPAGRFRILTGVNPASTTYQPIPVSQRIEVIFRQALAEQGVALSARQRKDLLKLADPLFRAIHLNLLDTAREVIGEPELPAELEKYRQQMLSALAEAD
jgi:hypothetical protein